FVNIERLVIILRPLPHPRIVMEGISPDITDDRRRVRTQLRTETVRVKAVHHPAVLLIDPELVHHARFGLLILRLKDTGLPLLYHLVLTAVPVIKLSDHFHLLRSRRIDPEQNALPCRVGAEILVSVKGSSRVKFVQYHHFHPLFSLSFACR